MTITLEDIRINAEELEAIAQRNPNNPRLANKALRSICAIDLVVRFANRCYKDKRLAEAYELIKLKADCMVYDCWNRE